MTSESAARIVLVSGAGMATFTLINASKGNRTTEQTYKSLWAIGLLTLGLAVFADFAPEVVGPFALLVLIAMAIRNTGALGGVLNEAGKKKKAAAPSAGGGGGTTRPAGPTTTRPINGSGSA